MPGPERLLALVMLCCCAAAQIGHCRGAETDGEQPSLTATETDPGYCIIRPDEPASAEIFVDHNGRRFYFCCEGCRQDFLSDSSRFDALEVPGGQGDLDTPHWNAEPDPYANTFAGRMGRGVNYLSGWCSFIHDTLHLGELPSAILFAAALAWILFLVVRWRPRRTVSASRPSIVTATLITALFVPCFYADALRRSLNETRQSLANAQFEREWSQRLYDEATRRDAIHYATFFNYGNPPIPRPSKLPPSLFKTYYRGNDERSDAMFNGGNYRTVTFEIWLEDDSGRRLRSGDPLSRQDGLSLVVRFIRSPDTSSGYYTSQYMKRMFLTMQSGEFLGADKPLTDRLAWTMVEPDRVWMARYSLPDGFLVRTLTEPLDLPQWTRVSDARRPHDRGGIVYLCEDRFDRDRMIGARFHYAVRYDVRVIDGRVTPDSDLWMQATYRGRNFAALQIEDDQWLSSEPIPEK